MKTVLKKIVRNLRALGFSFVVFVILELLAWFSTFRDLQLFFWITLAGVGMLITELIISWRVAEQHKKEWGMPHLESRVWREHFTNHAVLPLLTFVFTAIFLWNNNVELFKQLFVIAISVVYVPLFVNLHASYRNEMKLRKETYYIFDLVRMIIFFLFVDASLDIFNFNFNGVILAAVLVGILSFVLLVLMVWLAKQLKIETYIFTFLSSLLLGFFYLILVFFVAVNPLTVSILTTIAFFLMLSYWHHKLDGSFDFHVFSEYLLITLLLLIIIISLS